MLVPSAPSSSVPSRRWSRPFVPTLTPFRSEFSAACAPDTAPVLALAVPAACRRADPPPPPPPPPHNPPSPHTIGLREIWLLNPDQLPWPFRLSLVFIRM